MVDTTVIPSSRVEWPGAVRIARARRRLDPFDDIADPADWPLLTAGEQATSPTHRAGVGDYRPVPAERRVSGPGAVHLMAPFVHVSSDRESRFSDASFGVLYAGRTSEVALFETMYHHGRFMAATGQAPGWTSRFLEISLDIDASLYDSQGLGPSADLFLDAADYGPAQVLGVELRDAGADGIAYPSVRYAGGECSALFYPDVASKVRELRYLDYHWDGSRVDFYRDLDSGDVYRIA